MMTGASFVRLSLLLMSVCSCRASTPLLAWSNTEVFSHVSANDLANPYLVLNEISKDLSKLDFVVVFASERLDFDDIARYGGLYGNAIDSALAQLQVAMESASSSVWGETEEREQFITDLSLFTFSSPQYLSWQADPSQLRKTTDMQLVVVELFDSWDRETSLSEHGTMIGRVMKMMEDSAAKYAAFYMKTSHRQTRNKRSTNGLPPGVFLAAKRPSNASRQVCNRTGIIYRQFTNDSKILNTTFCSLLCIHSTDNSPLNNISEPLLAVYWPSWVDQVNTGGLNSSSVGGGNYPPNYHCNMTTFDFVKDSWYCNTSSVQEYLEGNITSNSIKAIMTGRCSQANETEAATNITLEVEFMFFSGGSDKQKRGKEFLVLLPGKQQLTPGYWTMQLMVTDITNGNDSGSSSGTAIPHYLTRYRTNLDLSARNGSESPITEKRGLFYPFSLPFYTSYSCLSHKDHLWRVQGNLNRFVPTKLPFNSSFEPSVTDGPVLQFVGFQVQAFGNVYGAHANTTLLSFSSVYDCEGYFEASSLMGTFVIVIVTIMLYFAILALFSTQTVDRFDDPRGHTISVENLH